MKSKVMMKIQPVKMTGKVLREILELNSAYNIKSSDKSVKTIHHLNYIFPPRDWILYKDEIIHTEDLGSWFKIKDKAIYYFFDILYVSPKLDEELCESGISDLLSGLKFINVLRALDIPLWKFGKKNRKIDYLYYKTHKIIFDLRDWSDDIMILGLINIYGYKDDYGDLIKI